MPRSSYISLPPDCLAIFDVTCYVFLVACFSVKIGCYSDTFFLLFVIRADIKKNKKVRNKEIHQEYLESISKLQKVGVEE